MRDKKGLENTALKIKFPKGHLEWTQYEICKHKLRNWKYVQKYIVNRRISRNKYIEMHTFSKGDHKCAKKIRNR